MHYPVDRLSCRAALYLLLAFMLLFTCSRSENQTRPVLGLPGSTSNTVPQHQPASADEDNNQVFAGPEAQKSLEDMLHWAISNSDPEKLKSQAEAVQRNKKLDDILEQQKRVKELLDYMKNQPTETELMKDAIEILHDRNATLDEQFRALQALQILVEPIDSANDLGSLNGLQPVMERLTADSAELQMAAAYVIGTAASNNVVFQKQLLGAYPDLFKKLLDLAASEHQATATKGLYAVASMVRNLQVARSAFYGAGGLRCLANVIQNTRAALQVKRKALNLFADIINTGDDLHTVQQDVTSTAQAILHVLQDMESDSIHEEALHAVHEMAGTPFGWNTLSPLKAKDVIKKVSLGYETALTAAGNDIDDLSYLEEYKHLCKQIMTALNTIPVVDESKVEL